jgi:DNA repair exonuclease SbcCD ATPase subunit
MTDIDKAREKWDLGDITAGKYIAALIDRCEELEREVQQLSAGVATSVHEWTSGYGGRDEDDARVEESDRERIADLKRIIGKQEQELVEADLRLREANARADACLADVPGRWKLAQKLEQAEARIVQLEEHGRALLSEKQTAEAALAAERERRCCNCDEWDGPFGWQDDNGRAFGKCCVWTVNSSAANPGCGETHFRDTPADGYCYKFAARPAPEVE